MSDAIKFLIDLAMKGVPGVLKGAKAVEQLEKALTSLSGVKMPELGAPNVGGGARKSSAEQEAIKAARALEQQKTAAERVAMVGRKANAVAMGHDNAKMLDILPTLPIKLVKGELEQLKTQLRDDKLAVTNLSASMRQLNQGTSVSVGTFKLLEAQLQQKKNSLARIQEKLVLSGNAARFGSEGTNRLTTTLRELAEAAGGQGITGMVSKIQGIAKPLAEVSGLSEGAATGLVALGGAAIATTAAVVALGVGLSALVIGGAKLSIEAAEAKNDTLDMLDAMLGSQEAAQDTYAAITDMTRDLAFTQKQGEDLARALTAAGVTNTNMLKDSIRSIAEVESVIAGAGGKIQNIIERTAQTGKFKLMPKQLVGTGVQLSALYQELANRTGKGVKAIEAEIKAGTIKADVGIAALTKVLDSKFGGVAAKQAMDFGAQLNRLKGNFTRLFADVNTEPFLAGLKQIVDLFDTTTIAGTAMHQVFTDTFDGIFRAAGAVIPYVKAGLKGLIIVGLTTAVALKPLLFQIGLIGPGFKDSKSGLELFIGGMNSIASAAGAVASGLSFIVMHKALFYGLGIAIGVALLPLMLIPTILFAGAAAFVYIASKLGEFWDALVYLKDQAVGAGMGLVQGLVEGVTTGGASLLFPAIKTLAQKSIETFKNIFQIHSPSRVMMGMGANISLGVARGIPLGMPAVNDNMRRLVSIPAAPTPNQLSTTQSDRRQQSGGQAHITVTFAEGAIQIKSGDSVGEMRTQLVDMMADVFEEAALKAGLKVAS